MAQSHASRWAEAYRSTVRDLPRVAASAAIALCGMNTVVDARIFMHDVAALPDAGDADARAFVARLRDRAVRGVGGEVRVEWPAGPAWLKAHLPVRYALGGTGPHAARALSALGAPALVALQDRSARTLALFPPDVLIAEDEGIVAARHARSHGAPRPETFIFEYTAGMPWGPETLSRSSRIIVRFDDGGVDVDPAFDRLTPLLAGQAGAGLVSGFNSEPLDRLDAAIERIFGLARAWQAAGLPLVHLELAGYASREALDRVLQAAPGAVTSMGMSHSELIALDADAAASPMRAMVALGETLGVDRLCVHADHWAASVTRGDPGRERAALLTGCLLAGSRAAAGTPLMPAELDHAAAFHAMPFAELDRAGAWTFVGCPSPYLAYPATTLGLGDTFTAGCLLALGRAIEEGDAGRAGHSPRPSALGIEP